MWIAISAALIVGAIFGWLPLGTWFADKLLPGLVLAALISWMIPRALERYKGRRDHLYRTVDLLREQVRAYQKVATDSWRTPQTDITLEPIEADLDFAAAEMVALMKLATAVGMESLWAGPGSKGVKAVSALTAAAIGHRPAPGVIRPVDASQVARINEAAVALISLLLLERWATLNRR